ncbi:MAG: helix-turn-helix transcriptional regulator [Gemmatimonadales bacterium]
MSPKTVAYHECLARVIQERRLKAGLSQEALAAKAKVHRTYVGMIERGQRSPTCDIAYKLAQALGVSLSSLIREAEKRC